jgi:hypothetical protein
MSLLCTTCGAENLKDDFAFCPYCGAGLKKPFCCSSCGREVEPTAKFCPECGTPLHRAPTGKPPVERPQAPKTQIVEIEPPPSEGIAIEFLYSTSASFDFAVQAAQQFATFKQYGEGKKSVYRIALTPQEMDLALELVEYLKGWRRRTVYVDGEKVPWDSVFSFAWCYNKRVSSFKPEFYCFGYENTYQLNIWGCIQANLPFVEHAQWLTWGRWVSKDGDWEFDKERLRHELQKNLYPYRFCPAIQLGLVEEVLEALPARVNPKKDKDWKFVQSWDDTPGLVMTVSQYGFREEITMIGVAPSGTGALQKIMKKVKSLRLPPLPAS